MVRELLDYDPETGALTWRERGREHFMTYRSQRSWNAKHAGKGAGNIDALGYHVVQFGTRKYKAHRLAWLYVHGVWPDADIDHINGVRADNRLRNLRAVSHAENARNVARSSRNTSGVVGVSWHSKQGKWVAYVKTGGRLQNLGAFDNKEEAISVREKAVRERGFHENHGRAA
jgi:hypothetical protein